MDQCRSISARRRLIWMGRTAWPEVPEWVGFALPWHALDVTTTYHVTASTGSWRSVPWPFGLSEVSDHGLCVRSWHWAWWVRDRNIPRESVEAIKATERFGALRLKIAVERSSPVNVQVAINRRKLIEDLMRRGYPRGLIHFQTIPHNRGYAGCAWAVGIDGVRTVLAPTYASAMAAELPEDMDATLSFFSERCHGEDYLYDSGWHTFPGRMSACCPHDSSFSDYRISAYELPRELSDATRR